MVHLPPDSRLLASLVKQEQAYASQLYNLLNTSNASLSALVIYASSSPTEISSTLKNVANALSGTDDAFRNYGEAINNWIDQLRSISRKEEEVANMGRQREILVTRLIKVSQKSKTTPQSLLHSTSDTGSTVSFKSFNSKVSSVQMELQACESHLANQERELEAYRLNALKHGLQSRCQALVQCAWTWGELGRLCLSFLSELSDTPSPNRTSVLGLFQPLSTNGVYDHDRASALSSLAPSQSASQMGTYHNNDTQTQAGASSSHVSPYSLKIPPPHRVPENGTIPVPSPIKPQFQQQQEEEGSSSDPDVPVEVHENPQYKRRTVLDKARDSIRKDSLSSPQHSPNPRLKTFNSETNSLPSNSDHKGRKSHGLFGGLASLFKTSMSGKSSQQRNGGWDTRTDRNIRGAKTDIDDSSDEELSNSRKLSKRRSKSAVRHSRTGSLTSPGPTPLTVPSPSHSPIGTQPPQQLPQQLRDRRGSLTRTGSERNRLNEPTSIRSGRERAVSLSSATQGRQTVDLSSDASSRILIGGYGGSPQREPRSPHPHFSPEGGLSRIAEDSSAHDGPSTSTPSKGRSYIPQAPPSVLSSRLDSGSTTISSGGPVNFPVRSPSSTMSVSRQRSEKKPLKSALRNTSKERDGSISPLPASISSTSSPVKPPPVVLPAAIPVFMPTPQASPLRPLTPISPTLSDPIPAAVPTVSNNATLGSGIPPLQLPVALTSASATAIATSTPPPPERPSSPHRSVSETSSISSYETGREDFYDLDEENRDGDGDGGAGEQVRNDNVDLSAIPVLLSQPHPEATSPLASPELQSQPQPTAQADVHEVSSVASGDTATANGPGAVTHRRKSVRMSSLPPEVLERTPTQEDYEEGGIFARSRSGSRSGFSDATATASTAAKPGSGWKSRAGAEDLSNVWEDSSSEDEGYKAAKRALTRTKRHRSSVHR